MKVYGTRIRVTNLENKRQVEVRIIDRGPTRVQRKKGTIIDLSRAAAEKLRMVKKGRVKVRLEVVKWGKFKKISKEDHEDDTLSRS
ncbi:MAG: septal ring lytic transglycosylase RlpA family protein [Pseudomonadota bacterium]